MDQDYLIPYLQTKAKLTNKYKKRVSEEYIKRMLGEVGLTDRRAAIVKALQEESVDIRMLNNLKRQLLDSQSGSLVPLAEYLEVKGKVFKGKTTKADAMLFEEIKGPCGNTVDVGKLAEIVDVCNHLPLVVKR